MEDYRGKVVVITGGASGIGKGIASAFSRAGATVIFADLDKDKGEKTLKELKEINGETEFIQVDVSKEDAVKEFAGKVIRDYGSTDVLVNNVGVNFKKGTLVEHSSTDFHNTIYTNLYSYFLCSKYFLPVMKEKGGGVIINIASTMGLNGTAQHFAYSVSKGGIVTMTKSMALDYASDNIRVNAVAPGLIRTPATENWISRQEYPASVKGVPLGIVGMPEDVAEAVLYLASERARYITGIVLVVDGGLTLGE